MSTVVPAPGATLEANGTATAKPVGSTTELGSSDKVPLPVFSIESARVSGEPTPVVPTDTLAWLLVSTVEPSSTSRVGAVISAVIVKANVDWTGSLVANEI